MLKVIEEILRVAFGEHQASAVSVWLVIFSTAAKASWVAKLSFTIPKYCKTFDSTMYTRPRGFGYRIHWRQLSTEVRHRSKRIHQRIWWRGSSPGALENEKYPFIAIARWSTLARSGSIWKGSISRSNWSFWMSANKWHMLNWIVWNRTVWHWNWVQTNDLC